MRNRPIAATQKSMWSLLLLPFVTHSSIQNHAVSCTHSHCEHWLSRENWPEALKAECGRNCRWWLFWIEKNEEDSMNDIWKVILSSQRDSVFHREGIEYIESSEHQVTKGFSDFSVVAEEIYNYPKCRLCVFGSGTIITQAQVSNGESWTSRRKDRRLTKR